MLLSTSPTAAAFMPMSSIPADSAAAMLYHRRNNFSDDECCPSTDSLNDIYASATTGTGGNARKLRTYPTFPPMSASSARPKVVRPNGGGVVNVNGASAKVSVLHRRTTTYNLSLQDFHQPTSNNKFLVDDVGNRPKKSACRPTLIGSATFAGRLSHLDEKAKKRVVFADDRGYQLTEIRFMSEPSDMPPKIRSSVLRALLGDAYVGGDSASSGSCWNLTFKQPASDYVAFRRRLDEANVGLENVLLTNGVKPKLVGTVKVKNLSFEKHVFVRFTSDKWSTYVDHPCVFTPHIGSVQDGNVVFDTFQFEFDIPADGEKLQSLEMCVCYRLGVEAREFWDNNNGQNYKIASSKFTEDKNSALSATINNDANGGADKNASNDNVDKLFAPFQQCHVTVTPGADAFTLDFTNWAQFASWNHLTTDGPYW